MHLFPGSAWGLGMCTAKHNVVSLKCIDISCALKGEVSQPHCTMAIESGDYGIGTPCYGVPAGFIFRW